MKTILPFEYSLWELASHLNLEKLKDIIFPNDKCKKLVGITCSAKFYNYLLKNSKILTDKNSEGIEIKKLTRQKRDIEYVYK